MKLSHQSKNEIQRFQESALAQCLSYLRINSPFYQDLFQRYNIKVEHIKTIRQLTEIPTTHKRDFSERNFDFLCVEKNKIIDYTATSGTSGKAVTVALTENDLQRLAENEAQSFSCAGGGAGDLYQLMLTMDRQFMAGMAYFSGIRKLGAGAIRVGPASPKIQWDTMQQYRPNAIVAVPSFILKLIDYAVLNGIELNNSGIEKAICIGEPLRNADLSPNVLTERISKQWDIKLFSTYASTEMQTAFTECVHGQGGHLPADLIIVEILDDEGNQLGPGEFGEVTITSLGVEAIPLLRYRTGDICCYYDEPCKCGRNTIRLSPVVGRKDQMIKYKGTTFYPPAIFNALQCVPEVSDYLVEVKKNQSGGDEITIYIYQTGDMELAGDKIKASLKAVLRAIPELNFVLPSELQRLKASENRKPVAIVFR